MDGARGDNDVHRLVNKADLPEQIRQRIVAAVRDGRLGAVERIDVARELIAHFEDGLAAGRHVDELLAQFGPDALTARLIARGKRAAGAASAERRRRDPLLPALARDTRYALRRLRQSRGFTLTAVLSLALGIGANTAIFSVVNGLLLQGPPYEDPEQLVELYEYTPEFPTNVFSYPDFRDFRDATADVFAEVSATMITVVAVESAGGVETHMAELVSGSYFRLLRLQPAGGRLLGSEDDRVPGGHPVAVLAHRYWNSELGAPTDVVGSTMRLSGIPFEIVGIAPPGFRGKVRGLEPDLYLPIMMVNAVQDTGGDTLEARGNYGVFPRARLQRGVSLERAQQAADNLAATLRETYPDYWQATDRFVLIPTRDVIIFPMFDDAVAAGSWLLLGVVGLVLLIACANLASFLLARAIDRRKEIAVRMALGARRGALIRQLLVETCLLALVGGGIGVLLAQLALSTLGSTKLPFPIPMSLQFEIDGSVLLFSLAVSVGAGLLFGLAPALQATRPEIVPTLRDEAAGGGGAAKLTLRNSLVVAQVAVSVVLLVSAGLFLRSLQSVYALDPGFGREPSAILSINLPRTRYDQADAEAVFAALRNRFASVPGVLSVGMTNNLHLNQANTLFYDVSVDGVPPPSDRDAHTADWSSADDAYFDAAGIAILAGRIFEQADDAASAPVAIVSKTLAERFWPGESALGKTFRNSRDGEITVVGIAGDTKVRTLGEPARPFVYRPIRQRFSTSVTIVARTRVDPRATVIALVASLRDVAPDAMVIESKTMDDHLAVVRFPAQITAWMFGAFAALALTLATIGLYGLVNYAQAQRAREVGIRMSLGADTRSIERMLVGGGMRLVALGGCLGSVAALAAARLLSGLLFGVGTADPATFAGVILILGGIALLASWIPARRASHINPVEALRAQ